MKALISHRLGQVVLGCVMALVACGLGLGGIAELWVGQPLLASLSFILSGVIVALIAWDDPVP